MLSYGAVSVSTLFGCGEPQDTTTPKQALHPGTVWVAGREGVSLLEQFRLQLGVSLLEVGCGTNVEWVAGYKLLLMYCSSWLMRISLS